MRRTQCTAVVRVVCAGAQRPVPASSWRCPTKLSRGSLPCACGWGAQLNFMITILRISAPDGPALTAWRAAALVGRERRAYKGLFLRRANALVPRCPRLFSAGLDGVAAAGDAGGRAGRPGAVHAGVRHEQPRSPSQRTESGRTVAATAHGSAHRSALVSVARLSSSPQLAPLTQDLLRALCKKGEPTLRRELETALVEVARPRLPALHSLQLGNAGTPTSWRRSGYRARRPLRRPLSVSGPLALWLADLDVRQVLALAAGCKQLHTEQLLVPVLSALNLSLAQFAMPVLDAVRA